MKIKKVIIIGKKSFIGSNLYFFLKKFFIIRLISFDEINKYKNSIENATHIINTTIHKNYINKKYKKKFDFDRIIVEKLGIKKKKYIFLNSRKIYKPKFNISEKSKLNPINHYEKNKLITEIFLKSKIKNNLISLRISNIIGKRIFSKNRNNHKLFLDHFINLKKKNKIFRVNDDFKDFISIYQFCYMVKNIIKKNIVGIYNVSLGEKVYISEITKWLNSDYSKKLVFLNKQKDSFTLKNNKLLDKIGIKINKKQLERFCKSLKI